jgi:uncharacterized membrane protein
MNPRRLLREMGGVAFLWLCAFPLVLLLYWAGTGLAGAASALTAFVPALLVPAAARLIKPRSSAGVFLFMLAAALFAFAGSAATTSRAVPAVTGFIRDSGGAFIL